MIYSYINTRGNWENSKLCENTPPFGRRVSTQFLVFPISTRVDIHSQKRHRLAASCGFYLFINDLPDVIPPTTSTGLYADDTKLYTAIISRQDCDNLQEALTYVDDWSKESNINFNQSKCKALTISRRKQPIVLNYHLGSAELIRVDSEVDLGITVTSNLSWNRHITKLVTKANSTLGLLRRTCPMLTNCDARRTLYLSLVKSQLSCATEIWSPYQSLNKISLEKLQRRATRWILQVKRGDITYKDRLLALNILYVNIR